MPDAAKGKAAIAEAEQLLEEGSATALAKAKEALDFLDGSANADEGAAISVLAKALLQSDDLAAAQKQAEAGLELYTKLGDKAGQAEMNYVMTIVKINKGPMMMQTDAVKVLTGVQDSFKAAGSKMGEVTVMCDLITYYLGRKEKDEAEKIKSAISGLGLPKKDAALATKKVANAYFSMKETEEAHKIMKDALKLYKDAGDVNAEASAMKTEINMYLVKKDIPAALDLADKRVGVFTDKTKKAEAMKYVSQIQLEREDGFQDAISALGKARTAYKDAGSKDGEAETLATMAELYLQFGDTAEASKAANEAIGVSKIPAAMGIIAQVQLFSGDVSSAMDTAQDMLELAKGSGSKSGEAGALLAKANALFSMDSASVDGLTSAKDALLLYSDLGDVLGMQQALHTLANAFFAKGDLEEGLKCAKEALAYFRQTGDTGNEEILKQTIEEARSSIAELRKQVPKKPMALPASATAQATGAQSSPITESQVPADLLEFAVAGRKYWGVPKQVQSDPTIDAIERAPSHAIFWSGAMSDFSPTQLCVEFGDLVGTMAKGDVAKIPIVITTHGVNARMTGEMVQPHITGVSGVTVWGMSRTVRQEIPQCQIMLLDFASGLTSAQIPRQLRPPFPIVNESAYYHRARWEPQIAAVPSLFRRDLKRDNLTGGGGGTGSHSDPKAAARFMRKSFAWTGPSHKLDYCWYRQEWRACGPAEGDIGPMPPPPPCRAVRSS